MTCSPFDVVLIPFPFADAPEIKVRPALVISRESFNEFGLTTTAMITSARHSHCPGDVAIDHLAAGLPKPCIVRLKLFTIDNRLIRLKLGSLTEFDRISVRRELHAHLAVATF